MATKQKDYSSLIEEFFPDGTWDGDNYITYSPLRDDNSPGGAFTLDRWGNWSDDNSPHKIKKGKFSTLIKLWKKCNTKEAEELLLGCLEDEVTYSYQDADGQDKLYVYRKNYEYGKKITKAFVDEDGTTINKQYKGHDKPLYRLQDILNYPMHSVLVVEGEKCVESLSRQNLLDNGWVVTTWEGGVKQVESSDWSVLYERNVVIWPDADVAGRDAAEYINAELGGGCRVVDTTSFEPGSDIADFVQQKKKVKQIIDAAEVPRSGSDMYAKRMPISRFRHVIGEEKLRPAGTLENFKALLIYYGIRIRENLMEHKTEVEFLRSNHLFDSSGKINNAAEGLITSLSVLNNFPTGNIGQYITTVAQENAFHPVKKWLELQDWDGEDRLESLYSLFICKDGFSNELKCLLLKKWLISCVAAIYESQYRGRGVLTLQGPQSIGKTSIMASLFPFGFEEGLSLDPRNKDSIEIAISNWVCELGELEGVFKKSDIASLKSFITKQYDSIRFAYDRRSENYPRRTVYCATVNEEKFLNDHTGSTRFWVIPVKELRYQHDIDIGQLWAQIKTIYATSVVTKQQAAWWLTPEEEILLNESSKIHNEIDDMEELITDCYSGMIGHDTSLVGDMEMRLSTSGILASCGKGRAKKYDLNRMANTLSRLGFEQHFDKNRNNRWVINPHLFGISAESGGADL